MVRTKEKFKVTEKSQTLFRKVAPKIMKSRKIHIKKSKSKSKSQQIGQTFTQ